MIFIPLHHATGTFHVSMCPLWIVAEFTTDSMCFKVCFIHHQNTHLIAQIIYVTPFDTADTAAPHH